MKEKKEKDAAEKARQEAAAAALKEQARAAFLQRVAEEQAARAKLGESLANK